MKALFLVICSFLFVCCGSDDPDVIPHTKGEVLRIINQNSRGWAVRVGPSSTNDPDFDSSIGDANIFDGLLCMSGEQESCDAVKAAQGPQGMWWRAPALIEQPYGAGSLVTRDVALGALAYLAQTRDREAALRWEDFIRSRGYHLCSTDDRNCDITPPLWSMFFWVWDRIGIEPMNLMKANKFTYRTLDELARGTREGSPLHLIGVEAFILKSLDVSETGKITGVLVSKQPENPFFQYLNGNYAAAADEVLKQCPMERQPMRQMWRWERPYPHIHPLPLSSGGWDCIFMTNLLLRDNVGL